LSKVIQGPDMQKPPVVVGDMGLGSYRSFREELEHARQEMAHRQEEAVKAAKALREEGYRQGLLEGRLSGEKAALQKANDRLSALETLAAEARQDRDAVLRAAEKAACNLALRLAEAIVHRQIQVDPSVVLGTAQTVLEAVNREPVVIKASPADVANLQAWLQESGRSFEPESIRVVADPDMTAGGCMVETAAALLDARIETQLQTAKQVFTALLEGKQDESDNA